MTLKALYQSITHDTATHQRTIAAALARESRRRRKMAELRVKGQTLRAIGERFGISHASVQACLTLTMRALYKRIHNLPRYHLIGRARRLDPPTQRSIEFERTPMVSTRGPAKDRRFQRL